VTHVKNLKKSKNKINKKTEIDTWRWL